MAKTDLSQLVLPRCRRVADELGFELVDVSLDRENTGKYLRIYIDCPEGMDLDRCEKYHRAIQPLVEDYDYDFLEVSSPGIDRPLKKDADFERTIGQLVEAKLFKSINGMKEIQGTLTDYNRDQFTLDTANGAITLERRACALIKPVVDMDGVEDVDLSE